MIDKWQRVGTAHIALDAQNCPVGLLKSVGSIKTADGIRKPQKEANKTA